MVIEQIKITKSAKRTIERIVVTMPDQPFNLYSFHMALAIPNITPEHYLYLGFVIGQIEATEKTLTNFHNTQNPFSKCRAN